VPASSTTKPRRTGRPTSAEAQQLDQDIKEAALELFLSAGYDGTSMDDIATRARTTKQSVYLRFTGKDELFRAALDWAAERPDWPVREAPPPDTDDLEAALRAIADAALRRALHPQTMALARLAIAQAERFPELGRHTYGRSWPRTHVVADLLRKHAEQGSIEIDDADVAAEQFLGLVAMVPAMLAQVGVVRDRKTQRKHTDAAVKLFLRSLRPD
jgi:AcrR family transcriptional regulator